MSRFKKDTGKQWLGSIPEEWGLFPLGRIFDERREATTAVDTAPLSVTKRGVVDQLDDVAISLDGAPKKLVRKGDIVINSRSDRKGSSGLSPRDGSVSVINTVIRPVGLDSRYAHHLLRSAAFQEEFYRFGSGIVADLWTTRWTAMKSITMPVPPLNEQRLIADYLDRETAEIDALIAEQTDLLALLSERRSSLVDSSLSALGSARISLKHCGSLSTGLALGATYSEPVSPHPYIRVANVQAGRLDLSTIAEVEVPDRVAETRRLKPGDVLMTEGGDRDKLGRGALWSGEIEGALHQNHVFAFRCGSQLEPRFLVYVLESSEAREYFEATASQSTNLASTNSTLVKRFKIPHVPVDTQREVVEKLESEIGMLEVAGEEAIQLIQLVEERRSALISAAVTGQIDVTDQEKSAAEQIQDELEVGV